MVLGVKLLKKSTTVKSVDYWEFSEKPRYISDISLEKDIRCYFF